MKKNTRINEIVDAGDLSKYRIELPNLIDDLRLAVHDLRLYIHLKRIASRSGVVRSTRDLAAGSGLSVGQVSTSKQNLVDAGLITVQAAASSTVADQIELIDLWRRNHDHYAGDRVGGKLTAADLHKWRIELPILLDDLDLSVYAVRLYVHVLRVCGAYGGVCRQSARTLADICAMSPSSVSTAKADLIARGLLTLEAKDRGGVDRLRVVDVWDRVLREYAGGLRSPGDQVRSPGDHGSDRGGLRSPGDQVRSPGDHVFQRYGDQVRSPGDHKNIRIGGEGEKRDPVFAGLPGIDAQKRAITDRLRAADLLRDLGVVKADDLAASHSFDHIRDHCVAFRAEQLQAERMNKTPMPAAILAWRIAEQSAPVLSADHKRMDLYRDHQSAAEIDAAKAREREIQAEIDALDRGAGLDGRGAVGRSASPRCDSSPAVSPGVWGVSGASGDSGDRGAIWGVTMAELAQTVGGAVYDQWLDGAEVVQIREGGDLPVWVIGLRSPAALDWVRARLGNSIRRSLASQGVRVDLEFAINETVSSSRNGSA